MEYYNEHELANDKLIWNGYTYVINGEVTVLKLPEDKKKMTVGEYKTINMAQKEYTPRDYTKDDPTVSSEPIAESAIKSIKNCDMKGRGLPLKRGAA